MLEFLLEQLLPYGGAGFVGAFARQLESWRNVVSRGRDFNRWRRPYSILSVLTGAGLGLIAGVQSSSLIVACVAGALWPTLLRAADDIRLWRDALRKKLDVAESTSGGDG